MIIECKSAQNIPCPTFFYVSLQGNVTLHMLSISIFWDFENDFNYFSNTNPTIKCTNNFELSKTIHLPSFFFIAWEVFEVLLKKTAIHCVWKTNQTFFPIIKWFLFLVVSCWNSDTYPEPHMPKAFYELLGICFKLNKKPTFWSIVSNFFQL